jgi:hypothetical protein
MLLVKGKIAICTLAKSNPKISFCIREFFCRNLQVNQNSFHLNSIWHFCDHFPFSNESHLVPVRHFPSPRRGRKPETARMADFSTVASLAEHLRHNKNKHSSAESAAEQQIDE